LHFSGQSGHDPAHPEAARYISLQNSLMKVFIAGGAGAIGRQCVPRLVDEGHDVAAISRSESGVTWLRAQGATAEMCDVFNVARLRSLLARSRPNAVVHQLTDISPHMHPGRIGAAMAGTNRLRTQGMQVLVNAARSSGARRFILSGAPSLHRHCEERSDEAIS
jgi:nucleoside-diphosphate-sugar epimerase